MTSSVVVEALPLRTSPWHAATPSTRPYWERAASRTLDTCGVWMSGVSAAEEIALLCTYYICIYIYCSAVTCVEACPHVERGCMSERISLHSCPVTLYSSSLAWVSSPQSIVDGYGMLGSTTPGQALWHPLPLPAHHPLQPAGHAAVPGAAETVSRHTCTHAHAQTGHAGTNTSRHAGTHTSWHTYMQADMQAHMQGGRHTHNSRVLCMSFCIWCVGSACYFITHNGRLAAGHHQLMP